MRFSCVRMFSHDGSDLSYGAALLPLWVSYTRNIFNRETAYRLPTRFLGRSRLRKVLCTVLISKQPFSATDRAMRDKLLPLRRVQPVISHTFSFQTEVQKQILFSRTSVYYNTTIKEHSTFSRICIFFRALYYYLIYIVFIVFHLHTYHGIVLPLEKVSFKDTTVNLVWNGVDHFHDLRFQVHKAVDICVDLITEPMFCHLVFRDAFVIPAARDQREKRDTFGASGIEIR